MFTYILAALGLLVGIGAAAYSLTAQIKTGEHLAALAVAAFAFVAALGVWRGVGLIEEFLDGQKK